MINRQVGSVVVETTEALQTQDGGSIRAGVWVTAANVITAIIGAIVVNMNQRRTWIDSAYDAHNEDFRRLREKDRPVGQEGRRLARPHRWPTPTTIMRSEL